MSQQPRSAAEWLHEFVGLPFSYPLIPCVVLGPLIAQASIPIRLRFHYMIDVERLLTILGGLIAGVVVGAALDLAAQYRRAALRVSLSQLLMAFILAATLCWPLSVFFKLQQEFYGL
ncbi:MAG TPA: hypothetical protein VGE52_00270 [Pirellulales bacterium]